MVPDWQKVSEAQLRAWLDTYPRRLQRDRYLACDPPLVTYNDFTLGQWPDSSVANAVGDRAGNPPYSVCEVRADLQPVK